MNADEELPKSRAPAFGPWRREGRAYLELFAVSGFALAQPMFDLLGKNVGIFVARRSTVGEVVLLTLGILFGPALIAWVVEAAAGLLVGAARPWVHALLGGGFGAVFTLETAKQATEWGPTPLRFAALLGGAAVAGLLLRLDLARQFLRIAAFGPVVLAAIFLFASPVSRYLFGSTESAAGVTIGNPKRVVMIALDELPLKSLLDSNGVVDAELYPNFAALGQTSTLYRNMTAVAPYTETALPAILTGRYPAEPGAKPIAADYPDSIFRLLGGVYRMNVREPSTQVCPDSICASLRRKGSLPGEVAGLAKTTRDLWWQFAMPERVRPEPFAALAEIPAQLPVARNFATSLQPSSEPTFDYLHLLLPHQPWQYFPTLQAAGALQDDPWFTANLIRWGSDGYAELAKARHVIQLQATDVLLGQIRARLVAIDAWDDALVVVTADHGVAFETGEAARTASRATAGDILWTPLFLKQPGQTIASVDDRPLQTVDLVPTIADVLDVEIPWSVDGVSALGEPREESARPFYQWRQDRLQPDDADVAPGRGYLEYDPARYWPDVLKGQGVASGRDATTRPYRIGPYGSIVGESADAYLGDVDSPIEGVTRSSLAPSDVPNPAAPRAPWTWQQGYVIGTNEPGWLALTVNGTVAGLAPFDPVGETANSYYFAVLSPSVFRAGPNDVRAYVIGGAARRPQLREVPWM